MAQRDIVFLFNLLQDVNILRGLVYLARRETEARLRFLVSAAFLKRDRLEIWKPEIDALAAETGARVDLFDTQAEVRAALQGGGGLLIAASESHLDAHHQTRDAFRVAPSSYLKITLQHGLECVGFLQSREHVIGHGRDIRFNADVVCGWLARDRLTSLTASERGKLCVTGPPTLLQRPRPHPDHPPQDGGIVCENMHSVRLQASGDHKASFMDIFFDFCARQAEAGRDVTLRPHPGGQYVLKHNVALPGNVRLNNLPIYHVNLPGYAYGISAPSTIVLDMVLAGIPVGVWRDPGGIMDAGNYDGLTEISALPDWIAFERDARLRPEMLLERQRGFLDRLGMVADPAEVYRRFARLLVNGLAGTAQLPAPAPATARPAALPPSPRRLLIAAEAPEALRRAFVEPLAGHFDRGEMTLETLSHQDLGSRDRLQARIAGFAPDLILSDTAAGPHARHLAALVAERGIPLLCHLRTVPDRPDDAALLSSARLIACATPDLKRRLRAATGPVRPPVVVLPHLRAEPLLRTAEPGPVHRVGCAVAGGGFADGALVAALAAYLARNPDVTFELLGSEPMPAALSRFGSRAVRIPPPPDPAEARRLLAGRAWQIGVCAPSGGAGAAGWFDYTACGAATVLRRGHPDADAAGEGRGLAIGAGDWETALQTLTERPDLRYRMALLAQTHLLLAYPERRRRDRVLDLLRQACRPADTPGAGGPGTCGPGAGGPAAQLSEGVP